MMVTKSKEYTATFLGQRRRRRAGDRRVRRVRGKLKGKERRESKA
jgi:hypothetical protein